KSSDNAVIAPREATDVVSLPKSVKAAICLRSRLVSENGSRFVQLFSKSTMSAPKKVTVDGNEAAAYVAYRVNETMAIYPITPSSTIAEWCDQWASEGKNNLWGTIPSIV